MVPPAGKFESLSREAWDAAGRSLLTSVVDLTRLVLPGMKERRWGRILNITSIAVKQPVDNLILSNSLRAAVTGFAKTLSNEVAEFGVTVNNIMPGYTSTERVEKLARLNIRNGRYHDRRGKKAMGVTDSYETARPTGRVCGAGDVSGLRTC